MTEWSYYNNEKSCYILLKGSLAKVTPLTIAYM